MSAKNSNENQHFIIFKTEDRKIEVDVRFQGETVWLTLDQMAALFERDKSTISRHIKNIFEEGELAREAVVANFATTDPLFNSPSVKMFFICLEIVDLSR